MVVADGGDVRERRGGDFSRLEARKSYFQKSSSYAQHIELSFHTGILNTVPVTLNGSGIQLAVGPQPLRLRNHNFRLAHRIMVKRLATSRHDPLGITDSACKNQLVVVSVQYGPFNPYIPIRSTTIGKSRVARDPIAMHTSWRSNSDITSVTRSMTRDEIPSSACTRRPDEIGADGFSSSRLAGNNFPTARGGGGGGAQRAAAA
ncbi:anaphase-promoting complex subunit 5-like [Dorcoceras hygrometricum]|uniref:Anaphase-promoting complex subunit 5-like n=1 Tax=Dorcoceras hygrometricum TaxID=472368 RepID=A0A2Z7DFG4_9LAMI|nr:anaphase-promoting complex subunit 5-like [Dorcoceras hygrometricum]